MAIQELRIEKLKNFLDVNQGALIKNNSNIYYYCNFNNSEGVLLVTKSQVYLLVDFRYFESAKKNAVGCSVILFDNMNVSIKELLLKHNIKSLLIEEENTTLFVYNRYIKLFNEIGVSLISQGNLDNFIKKQRMIKSEEEITFIKTAQKITEKAYSEVLNYIKPEVSERKIALELEYLIKSFGGQDVSFDLITISGKKTSLPHGVPNDNIIKSGDFFTMDIGAVYNGYHSDMTRTVAVQSYTDEMAKIYSIVLNAQTEALKSIKSGIKANFVDNVARKIISDAGYGKCFGHSTGHGVGLDIHELPFISPKSDTVLEENMVITVEPGIYIEDCFGVRIEDMISVKNDGYENFASISKELIVI